MRRANLKTGLRRHHKMKATLGKAIFGLAILAAVPFSLGCGGTSSAQETTSTTTSVMPAPAPAAPVIVQPVAPAERTSVTEEKATDSSAAYGPNSAEQST